MTRFSQVDIDLTPFPEPWRRVIEAAMAVAVVNARQAALEWIAAQSAGCPVATAMEDWRVAEINQKLQPTPANDAVSLSAYKQVVLRCAKPEATVSRAAAIKALEMIAVLNKSEPSTGTLAAVVLKHLLNDEYERALGRLGAADGGGPASGNSGP